MPDVSVAAPDDHEQTLEKALAAWLAGATRLAVLAVGSRLRGDDAAGLVVTALLRRQLNKTPARMETLLLQGDTAPENVTGQIKSFRPSHLLVIDAADTGREAGHIDQVDPKSLSANLSATSHSLPIRMVIDYITHYAPCAVTIVGIQPERIEFGQRVTGEVRLAARRLARLLGRVVGRD
jgi:hydrogenase 3 maturation protease